MQLSTNSLHDELITRLNNNSGNYDLYQFKKLATDLITGMAYLCYNIKSTKIFHFDIKPQNILFINPDYKIADFGTGMVYNNKSEKLIINNIL